MNSDPIGKAILCYINQGKPKDIVVTSDLTDDDIIPVEVLFRSYEEMPDLEKKAMSLVRGKVLDVGAGAGPHASYLLKRGFEVTAIDTSEGAVTFLLSQGIKAECINIRDFKSRKFDTILLLMNGIGIAGRKANLPDFLRHLKTLLHPGGQILCDSSDVKYLYEEDDGSFWMDLNSDYYGDFTFQMQFEKDKTPPFPWCYVDYDTLHEVAVHEGFSCERIELQENHFLAQLTAP